MDDSSENSFTPRDYQIEVLEAALENNIIAYLGTGTGKTFIAIMLIRENATTVRRPYCEGGKRIFFLTPTMALVDQQAQVVRNHTDLNVKGFYGEMYEDGKQVESWNKSQWIEQFHKNEVLVMTPKLFSDILQGNFIPISSIQLLIIDECHRAQGNHPYCEALNCFKNLELEQMPRILGLTASLLNGKCKLSKLEDKLRNLELTLRSTILIVRDSVDLQKHGTDPKECVVLYSKYKTAASDLLKKTIEQIDKIKLKEKGAEDDDEELLPDKTFFQTPLKCLKSLKAMLMDLGLWCAHKAADIYKKQVETLLHKPMAEDVRAMLQNTYEFLAYFLNACEELNPNSCVFCIENTPMKLKKLLDVLCAAKKSLLFQENPIPVVADVAFEEDPEKYYENMKQFEKKEVHLCSLIFVEQRITAYVMREWLLAVKDTVSELKFISPEFVVGQGRVCDSQTSMTVKGQQKKLLDFRQNRCNVLVATQVLEEGMDIRQCNLVIRLDMPKDNCSYVQSKGRARARNSIYVMLVEDGVTYEKFMNDLADFKIIEKIFKSNTFNRPKPDEEEIGFRLTGEEIPPYMPHGPNGPRIAMTSAIDRINRYCARLPTDKAHSLVPHWNMKTLDKETNQFVCELRMPINSPYRQTIESQPMQRKKLAKMSAALKACQLLYENGEMDENLFPTNCLVKNAIKDEIGDIEPEDSNGAIPGTNRRRQIYKKRVNPFTIFTKSGKVLVTVSTSESSIKFTEDEIGKIKEFHHFIFSDALWLEDNKRFLPSAAPVSYYILPVNRDNCGYRVDWCFISETVCHPYHEHRLKTSATFNRTAFNEKTFTNAVLMCSYKMDCCKSERPDFYYIMKIKHEMSPQCSLEDTNKTFKEYFYDQYKVAIQNDNQPLLEAIKYTSLILWKPLYISENQVYAYDEHLSKNKQSTIDFHEYLVPELCLIHPFPQPFFFKVVCLPTVLFRLNGLLLAEEIRQTVAREAFVGIPHFEDDFKWPRFNLETSDKALMERLHLTGELKKDNTSSVLIPRDITKDSEGNITSFEVKLDIQSLTGPAPSLLLQALTAKGAGDEFDLERLEMIGDSFLKYAMSVKTYIKYPNFHEGYLTSIRSELIQNLRLYQKAKRKNLGEYMITTPFCCKTTWVPPCYFTEDVIDEKTLIEKTKKQETDVDNNQHLYFTKQVISDKCVADSVEALIGAYLLTCGHQGALRFMSWLGLNPLVEDTPSEEGFVHWPPSPLDPIVGEKRGVQQRLKILTDGFDKFEKEIKYKFKNKAYLLQAFTHPSYSYNNLTDCYQRLEFLGDAVLDYLITRQLYEDPSGHSPGKLTDLRSALVNNMYFASLAVTYKYHIYLQMRSPHLYGMINKFLNLQENEAFKFFETHKYYLKEVECFDLKEVEVPKALGDVFESVAGAIYLDSGMSLDTVWNVCYPMIKPAMDYLAQHVPMSPIRELYEKVKTKNLFGDAIKKGDKTYIEVTLPDGKTRLGVGPNKKVAKRSAAKQALAYLHSQRTMDKKPS